MKLFRKNCLKNIIVLITSILILGQGYSYPAPDNSLNSIEYGTSNNLLTELLKWCGSDNGATDEFPVFPYPTLNFKSSIALMLLRKGSLPIFQATAIAGKKVNLFPSASIDAPSALPVSVSKYLSFKL